LDEGLLASRAFALFAVILEMPLHRIYTALPSTLKKKTDLEENTYSA